MEIIILIETFILCLRNKCLWSVSFYLQVFQVVSIKKYRTMAPFPPERESDQSGNQDSTVPGGNRGTVFAPFGNSRIGTRGAVFFFFPPMYFVGRGWLEWEWFYLRNAALRKIVALFCRVIGYTMSDLKTSIWSQFLSTWTFQLVFLYRSYCIYVNSNSSNSHDSSLNFYSVVIKQKHKTKKKLQVI